jgi:AAHS family 4-hydroxybenzoate transporter-like MFS transporter
VLAAVLFFALPESPRFLARHRNRWPELSLLLSRFTSLPLPGTTYTDLGEQRFEQHKGFLALLTPEYRRDSLTLWSAFFFCMLTIYSAFSWLPTMLVSAGLGVGVASSGLTAYNAGGVLGALLCAVSIGRFGSRVPLLACCAAGAGSALLLTRLQLHEHSSLLIFGLGIHGLFVNAVQSTMYALCAHIYPTVVRTTGTASAVMCGRLGAVLSSFAAAAIITRAGASGYLTMLGAAMILVFVALAATRHHIAPPDVAD